MAYELENRFDKLKAPSDDLSPTPQPPAESEASNTHDNAIDGVDKLPQEACSEKNGPTAALDISQSWGGGADRDPQWLAGAQDAEHTTTQPINVPSASGLNGINRSSDKEEEPGSPYQEPSPLEEFMRNRRPSITFHPQVTLDSGHRRPLDEPLPKLAIITNPRSHSIVQELITERTRSPLLRSHSETDCSQYDKVTGEQLTNSPRENTPGTEPQAPGSRPQWPLLQSTVDGLAEESRHIDPPQGASLTSDSTASTAASEPRTPTDGMDIVLSPISARSPFPSFPYPTSLEESSAWPKPRRQACSSRAASYASERKSSIRQGARQGSRRSTSSGMSPATAFLSKFAREPQESVIQPDSEGQEVGEYVMGRQVGFGGFSTVKEAYTIEGDERICRAVKIVRKQVPGKDEIENERFQVEFEHEVNLWRCLGHRNILPLIEVYVTDYATFCFTKLNTGGTLFDLIRANRQGLSRDLARRYAYQLASAIRYLHEDVRVVHRDIKLENCLIDISDAGAAKQGGNVLLCDFGLAEFATEHSRQSSPDTYENRGNHPSLRNIGPSETSTSIAGSLQYASPELIISPAGFISSVVDVWAYGVVIYALLVGDLPFQHTFQPRVQMKILAGEWNTAALEAAAGVAGYEEEVLEFVSCCLDMKSESRWTIARVLKSRWLQGCQEMLEELNEDWKL
ncbi:hypothetical protein ACLMJK_000799 [Lecanora helva]